MAWAVLALLVDPTVKVILRWLVSPLERYVRNIVRDESLRPLVFGDRSRLHIAPTAVVSDATFNVGSGTITVEDHAFFGHHVTLLAGRHDYRKLGRERQHAVVPSGCDIVVRTGAWVATNATILGPCVIGEHAVVGAGAVVNKNVPPYAIVAGVPARIVGSVEPRASAEGEAAAEPGPVTSELDHLPPSTAATRPSGTAES